MADPLAELRAAFRRCVAECGGGSGPSARREAAQALRCALERVEAELAAAALAARADPSAISVESASADIARLEERLRRKTEVVRQHSARLRDWQRRLDLVASESSMVAGSTDTR
jgi:hypothetical protein